MLKKNFKHTFRRQHKSAGFTLIELLVAVAMGWIVISALLYFVVQLSRTEQQELAMSETQRDMSVAVDYIGADLKDAVFVYDGECLITGRATGAEQCAGLVNRIPSIPNSDAKRPVLAFWKLETVPYVNNPTAAQQLPGVQTNGDCQGVGPDRQTECKNLLISRSSYTLVIYFLRTTPASGEVWDGPAQITRYALRQYNPDQLSNLTLLANNFRPPSTGGYRIWPCDDASCSPAPTTTTFSAANEDVLVDLVDNPQGGGNTPTCRLEGEQAKPYNELRYQPSYPEADLDKITSFYACVSPWKSGQGQEVKLYLRGNAFKRAGASGYNNTGFLPTVQAQVKTRSTFDRQPTSLY